jgi:hypothetical protein
LLASNSKSSAWASQVLRLWACITMVQLFDVQAAHWRAGCFGKLSRTTLPTPVLLPWLPRVPLGFLPGLFLAPWDGVLPNLFFWEPWFPLLCNAPPTSHSAAETERMRGLGECLQILFQCFKVSHTYRNVHKSNV